MMGGSLHWPAVMYSRQVYKMHMACREYPHACKRVSIGNNNCNEPFKKMNNEPRTAPGPAPSPCQRLRMQSQVIYSRVRRAIGRAGEGRAGQAMCLPSEQHASAGPGGGQWPSEPLEQWPRVPLESGAFPYGESRATNCFKLRFLQFVVPTLGVLFLHPPTFPGLNL